MRLTWVLLFCFYSLFGFAEEEFITTPPSELPIKVSVQSSIVNLSSIDEKNESFHADLYFGLKWKDSRLAYEPVKGEKFKNYAEGAVVKKLEKIWWPQIELLNDRVVSYTNRALMIFPDGSVELYLGIVGTFQAKFDFKTFPFDDQSLVIKLGSFAWDNSTVVFIPSSKDEELYAGGKDINEEELVVGARESVEVEPGLAPFGETSLNYSNYILTIKLKRLPDYYLFEVFLPLILIVGISCAIFFGSREPFLDKIMVNLTAFLVALATKFVVNQDLPQVGYLTVIDKAFLFAYLSIALSVIVDILQKVLQDHPEKAKLAKSLNYFAKWGIFVLFLLALVLIAILK